MKYCKVTVDSVGPRPFTMRQEGAKLFVQLDIASADLLTPKHDQAQRW